jgi:hypothetical protein
VFWSFFSRLHTPKDRNLKPTCGTDSAHTVTRPAPAPNPNMSRNAPSMSPCHTHHIPQPSTYHDAHARSRRRAGTECAKACRARLVPQESHTFFFFFFFFESESHTFPWSLFLTPRPKQGVAGETTCSLGMVRTHARWFRTCALVHTRGRSTTTGTGSAP